MAANLTIPAPAMNPRALLKSLLIVVILLGVAWLWWQSTTPDLPASPAAVQRRSKPVAISLIATKPLPEQLAGSNASESPPPLAEVTDYSIKPAATELSEAEARTAKARAYLEGILTNAKNRDHPSWTNPSAIAASLRNTNYALAHQDPSLPDSANLTLPLGQAEHHVFNLIGGSTREASIESYYYDTLGREQVELYTWQYKLPSGVIGSGGTWQSTAIANLDPADQDYIRNWAKQQAAATAATANSPAAPQESSEPEPAASAPTAQVQQGPLVITN